MCYGMNCEWELSNGDCGKHHADPCPMDYETEEEYESALADLHKWEDWQQQEFEETYHQTV